MSTNGWLQLWQRLLQCIKKKKKKKYGHFNFDFILRKYYLTFPNFVNFVAIEKYSVYILIRNFRIILNLTYKIVFCKKRTPIIRFY